jgi:TetR/AcrR family transcriptional repressor of nem operon
MARPKEFDRDEVLDRAMDVFWSKGYERTSISDLVAAMGINRGSIYDTFGGKDQLYRAALDHYCERIVPEAVAHLRGDTGSPTELIHDYFTDVVRVAVDTGNPRGCFISNTVNEFAGRSGEIADAARQGIARMEETFARVVERGQAEGEISTRLDARQLARLLVASLNGLRLVAKANSDRQVLEDIVAATMAALKDPTLT